MNTDMDPHVNAALDYARAVVTGEIAAGKWVKLAAQRQLADLERPASADWPWVFDAARAARPCRFVELLPHVKGGWANRGQLLKLEPWQCFVITTLFGWVHHTTRLRRFREAYIEVARKNGKSLLAGGLSLYMLTADGEYGAEVYCAATTRDQARIVFEDAKGMCERTPDLRNELGVAIMAHSITVAHTGSKMAPLAAEASTQDGLNPSFIVIDELHAHTDRRLYDVLDSARGAREQSLLLSITTAGVDNSGICYERRTHVTKVLESLLDDPAIFGVIYTIDEGDDPFDPRNWPKANPNFGISVLSDDMEIAARKAQALPSALNNFLTKRLNVWVNSGSPWMDMTAWRACADKRLRQLEDFAGARAWMGLDLAQKKDFAALCLVFEKDDLWHVAVRLYLNEQAVRSSTNAHLAGWAHAGFVHATPGNLTDFDLIAEDLRSLCQQFDVQEIAFDPALSQYFAGKLLEEGLPLVEITQRPVFFTPALIQVENLVLAKKLRHDDNPAMAWMVSNLVVRESKFSQLLAPTKDRDENKIDGPMAMLMALGRALSLVPGELKQAFVVL